MLLRLTDDQLRQLMTVAAPLDTDKLALLAPVRSSYGPAFQKSPIHSPQFRLGSGCGMVGLPVKMCRVGNSIMPRLADRRPLAFKEKDVARAVRAVRAGGERASVSRSIPRPA